MTGNNIVNEFIPAHPLNTAVLFLVFNRLDTAKQVFEEIKKAKPPRIYIASDGARKDKNDEAEIVASVRNYVLKSIDWECKVQTLFRDENLGCKYAVSGAINWFFEQEEMGIILEDDCLPSQSFFWYCEAMLEKYKNDTRMSMITGTAYLFNEVESDSDYFFSKYMSIWGWASWRRAWQGYDVKMSDWPAVKASNLLDNVFYWDAKVSKNFSKALDLTYQNKIDTWDYQWCYHCWLNGGYCVTPFYNLVSNIGYEGTRSSIDSPFINMNRVEIVLSKINQELPLLYSCLTDKNIFYNVFYRFRKSNKTSVWFKKRQYFKS